MILLLGKKQEQRKPKTIKIKTIRNNIFLYKVTRGGRLKLSIFGPPLGPSCAQNGFQNLTFGTKIRKNQSAGRSMGPTSALHVARWPPEVLPGIVLTDCPLILVPFYMDFRCEFVVYRTCSARNAMPPKGSKTRAQGQGAYRCPGGARWPELALVGTQKQIFASLFG